MKKLIFVSAIIVMMLSGCMSEKKEEVKKELEIENTVEKEVKSETTESTTIKITEDFKTIYLVIDEELSENEVIIPEEYVTLHIVREGKTEIVIGAKEGKIKKGIDLVKIKRNVTEDQIELRDSVKDLEEVMQIKQTRIISSYPLLLGDFDGDGFVGELDREIFLDAFGAMWNDSNFNELCNIDSASLGTGDWAGIFAFCNPDSQISIIDFTVFINNYEKEIPHGGGLFGGGENEYGNSIIKTEDNGYLLVGETNSSQIIDYRDPNNSTPISTYGGKDIYVIKLDENRNFQWQNVYGGIGNDTAVKVEKIGTGENEKYIIGGSTDSPTITGPSGQSYGNVMDKAMYLMTIDNTGEVEQVNFIIDGGLCRMYDFLSTIISGKRYYILVGSYEGSGSNDKDSAIYIAEETSNAIIRINSRNYISHQPGDDEFYAIEEITSGNYVAVGYAVSPATNQTVATGGDVILRKFNINSDSLWSETVNDLGYKLYDFDGNKDVAKDLISLENGNFAVVGYTTDGSLTDKNILALAFNSSGINNIHKSLIDSNLTTVEINKIKINEAGEIFIAGKCIDINDNQNFFISNLDDSFNLSNAVYFGIDPRSEKEEIRDFIFDDDDIICIGTETQGEVPSNSGINAFVR